MNLKSIRYEIRKETKEKPLLKVLLGWVFLSFLGIAVIKTVIRPRHLQLSETLDFLQGTLPNFFAATMFSALAFVYYPAFFKSYNRLNCRLTFALVFSFFGLTSWEFIQYFMGYPIDYFDLIMTALGSSATILLILLLRLK
ncbi:hypothetical protein [Mangrovibacterium sp.]|uniref:hypothetical protein n=1 Tax=Mangrovibacterium sp. TaxID=1961364 RepID=UPI003566D8CE